jgi:ATP:cob(I)alamin adenosyltransferase
MFTRRGDSGSTDTGDRRRVSKSSALVEVEGTLDEAISSIGNAIALSKWDDIRSDLRIAQEDLFTLGEEITASGHARKLDPARIDWLEERVVSYRTEVGPTRLFVVPDGTVQSTSMHLGRTVVRRLERKIVNAKDELSIPDHILAYVNRLSSLLFMVAILSNKRQGITERIWDIRGKKTEQH